MIDRRTLLPLLVVVLLLAAYVAGGRQAVAAPATQDTPAVLEPNDSFGKATPIDTGEIVRDPVSPRGDVDWYRLSVASHGELQVRVTDVAATLDIAFRIYDAERSQISDNFVPFAKGRDTQGIVDLPAPGDYYIQLQDNGGDADSSQPYSLQTVFNPAVDPEPNNSIGNATPLDIGEPAQATILPMRDVDYFFVEVDTHGELVLITTDVPPTVDIMFRVFNADTEVLRDWFYPLTTGADNFGAVDLPSAGRYYIEVRDQGDNARSVTPFTLETDFTPSADSVEPNDSFGRAALLTVGEPVTATILPRRDVDWFRFQVEEQGVVNVTAADVPPELDITFRLWNANRETVTDWFRAESAGLNTSGTTDMGEAGFYYLEVKDNGDDARSVAPYTVLVTLTPTRDAAEPNGSFGTAFALGMGTEHEIQASILPRRDADWFELTVEEPGILAATLTDVPPDLDLDLRFWSPNRDAIGNWFSPEAAGEDTLGAVDIPEPGRYRIEVHDRGDDGRSVEPYTLITSLEPSPDANEPNQELESATPVELGAGVSGAIFPVGDLDWYSVQVDEATDLYLLVTGVAADMDIAARLFNAGGTGIGDWIRPPEAGADTVGIIAIPESGIYYLQVLDNGNNARSLQPYTLILSTELIGAAGPLPSEDQPGPASESTPTPVPEEEVAAGAPVPDTAPPAEEPTDQPAPETVEQPTPVPAQEPAAEPESEDLPSSAATIGAAGGEIAADDASDPLARARLTVPPDAINADTEFSLVALSEGPAGAIPGLFPAGFFWQLGWTVTEFTKSLAVPAILSLPVPEELALVPMFLAGWTGEDWVALDAEVGGGEIAAPVEHYGIYGAFCGDLTAYRIVGFSNNTRSREIEVALIAGPSPLDDEDTATVVGCSPPADPSATQSVRRRSTGEFLMRPGRYELSVTYLLPQPEVTSTLTIVVPPGQGPVTVEIAEDGATSDDAGIEIEFSGRGS